MPIRYYPSFKIKTNQITKGNEFLADGVPYTGLYYTTYRGASFSGPNPIVGPNKPLEPSPSYNANVQSVNGTQAFTKKIASVTKLSKTKPKTPVSYFPNPIQSDYDLGYINRYFVKQVNNNGYITEISPMEYIDISNGAVGYDVSMLQTCTIAWKLTGPLNSTRISQYDTRAGIIDTNKRLVEKANPNFFGLIEFIGGNYSKFAKPTA